MLIKDQKKHVGLAEDWIDYLEESSTAKTVFESDEDLWTGLLDKDGHPIYKQSPRIKIGYI